MVKIESVKAILLSHKSIKLHLIKMVKIESVKVKSIFKAINFQSFSRISYFRFKIIDVKDRLF